MFIDPMRTKPPARFGRADNQVAILKRKPASARPNREAYVGGVRL